MSNVVSLSPQDRVQDGARQHIYLIGRPPIEAYLSFLAQRGPEPNPPATEALGREWRQAEARVQDLQRREPHLVEAPTFEMIPRALDPLVKRVTSDPAFKRSFGFVPNRLAMVEIDPLIVFQTNIDLSYVEQIKADLGPDPTDEAIFRLCLPFDHPHPEAVGMPIQSGGYVFTSPSNDLRFLEARTLGPEEIRDYEAPGPVAGVLGLVVGHGSNYAWAMHVENRLILHNGSHRFFALRDLGRTHAPCLIQDVGSIDDLNMVAANDVKQNLPLFVQTPRPPVLKDYFDAKLTRLIPTRRVQRQVRINIGVEILDIPISDN